MSQRISLSSILVVMSNFSSNLSSWFDVFFSWSLHHWHVYAFLLIIVFIVFRDKYLRVKRRRRNNFDITRGSFSTSIEISNNNSIIADGFTFSLSDKLDAFYYYNFNHFLVNLSRDFDIDLRFCHLSLIGFNGDVRTDIEFGDAYFNLPDGHSMFIVFKALAPNDSPVNIDDSLNTFLNVAFKDGRCFSTSRYISRQSSKLLFFYFPVSPIIYSDGI